MTTKRLRIGFVPPRGESLYTLRLSPWRSFIEEVERAGDLVELVGAPASFDALVAFWYDRDVRRMAETNGLDSSLCHLVILESDAILPGLYTRACLSHFGVRWAPSPSLARLVDGNEYRWPQDLSPYDASLNEKTERLPIPCMLLANKFSADPSENFSLRRRIVKHAIRTGDRIDVIGHHWERTRRRQIKTVVGDAITVSKAGRIPRIWSQDYVTLKESQGGVRYLGSVTDKFAALRRYEYSLVTENSLKWTTEKLVDSVVAGCVPFYVGASMKDIGLPEGICIECEPDASAIWRAVREVTPQRVEEVRQVGCEFVNDPSSQERQNTTVFRELGKSIARRLLE